MLYEVTFRIVPPKSPKSTETVAALVEVVRAAVGLPAESPAWAGVESKLRAGVAVRVRIGAEQFVRFFMRRRSAGTDAVHRLKWSDAIEVAEVAA